MYINLIISYLCYIRIDIYTLQTWKIVQIIDLISYYIIFLNMLNLIRTKTNPQRELKGNSQFKKQQQT